MLALSADVSNRWVSWECVEEDVLVLLGGEPVGNGVLRILIERRSVKAYEAIQPTPKVAQAGGCGALAAAMAVLLSSPRQALMHREE
jgi:hypothetical protein